MKIDIQKLTADIKFAEHELRELKKVFHEKGQPNLTSAHYANRSYLKKQATELYSLRAQLRHRVHSKQTCPDLETQAKYTQRLWKYYEFKVQAA